MTRKEAIEEIKKLEYYGRPFDNSLEECNKASRKVMALNMAIKALTAIESIKDDLFTFTQQGYIDWTNYNRIMEIIDRYWKGPE